MGQPSLPFTHILFSCFQSSADIGPVVIKIDTGMSRNGCQPEELASLVEVSKITKKQPTPESFIWAQQVPYIRDIFVLLHPILG